MSRESTGGLTELRRLFEGALSLPEEARAAFLDRECPNAARRGDVEELLAEAAHDGDSDFLEPPVPDRPDGERFGPFEVEVTLEEAGPGRVHRARDVRSGARVRLRSVRVAAEEDALLERLRRTGAVLADYSHPCVPGFLEAGVVPGAGDWMTLYFATEEVGVLGPAGGALQEELRRSLGDALDQAHAMGLYHGDVTKHLAGMDEQGRPRLLDLGLRQLLSSELCGPDTRRRDRILAETALNNPGSDA